VSRKKALKRKLGKKVLAGKITAGEARARLGREMAQKSAQPSWPVQPQSAPRPRYQGDDEFIRSAFAPIPRPAVTKSRKAAAPARPSQQQLLAKALADTMRDLADLSVPSSQAARPPMALKQLSGVERAVVAEYRRELELAEHKPAERERIKTEISRMTGFPYGVM
jgi:hypothetical protein